MQYKRAQRVSHLIREELGGMLLREVKDPRLHSITITDVRVSDDLRHVRVYFSVHADASEKQRALKGLQSASGFLRGELGRRLRLRYAPELSFFVDESLDHSLHIAELLRQLKAEEGSGTDE
ncbi:MAG: 30S ribosome-binding factor RbfA [candidate division NC10 bacterium]|nr:30S ribosome-binding factor RbfA [candidate division NC10 bacterium]